MDGWSTERELGEWRNGNREAGGRLYEHFLPLLRIAVQRGSAWRTLQTRCDVDDVVNEFWATVVMPECAKGYAYQGPDSFAAWLQTVLAGVEIDLARKATRKKQGEGRVESMKSDAGVLSILAGSAADPSPTSSARTREFLERAKHLLTPDEYDAFVLTKLFGYTSEEAGLAIRRTGSAVRGLIKRAQEKLLSELGTSAM